MNCDSIVYSELKNIEVNKLINQNKTIKLEQNLVDVLCYSIEGVVPGYVILWKHYV
jgi:hypothetical protein